MVSCSICKIHKQNEHSERQQNLQAKIKNGINPDKMDLKMFTHAKCATSLFYKTI